MIQAIGGDHPAIAVLTSHVNGPTGTYVVTSYISFVFSDGEDGEEKTLGFALKRYPVAAGWNAHQALVIDLKGYEAISDPDASALWPVPLPWLKKEGGE